MTHVDGGVEMKLEQALHTCLFDVFQMLLTTIMKKSL